MITDTLAQTSVLHYRKQCIVCPTLFSTTDTVVETSVVLVLSVLLLL